MVLHHCKPLYRRAKRAASEAGGIVAREHGGRRWEQHSAEITGSGSYQGAPAPRLPSTDSVLRWAVLSGSVMEGSIPSGVVGFMALLVLIALRVFLVKPTGLARSKNQLPHNTGRPLLVLLGPVDIRAEK